MGCGDAKKCVILRKNNLWLIFFGFRFMKLSKTFAILCLMLCAALRVWGLMPADYSALRKSVDSMPMPKVLHEGERLAKEGDSDRAIAILTAGADRYNSRMTETEKPQCVDIIMRLGKIQYSLSNYSEALRQFLRA